MRTAICTRVCTSAHKHTRVCTTARRRGLTPRLVSGLSPRLVSVAWTTTPTPTWGHDGICSGAFGGVGASRSQQAFPHSYSTVPMLRPCSGAAQVLLCRPLVRDAQSLFQGMCMQACFAALSSEMHSPCFKECACRPALPPSHQRCRVPVSEVCSPSAVAPTSACQALLPTSRSLTALAPLLMA